MLTVTVGFDGSGKSRTFSPLARRYSVMPSTVPTLVMPGATATPSVLGVGRSSPSPLGEGRGEGDWAPAFAGATGGVGAGGAGGLAWPNESVAPTARAAQRANRGRDRRRSMV